MRSMDLADELAETLDSLIASDSVASIALSGGSSPIGLYQDLSKKAIDVFFVENPPVAIVVIE